MNLKKVLMDLGNRLVVERGYIPGATINFMAKSLEEAGFAAMVNALRDTECKNTAPIVAFTNWLNNNNDAIEILEAMGIDWPVVAETETKEVKKCYNLKIQEIAQKLKSEGMQCNCDLDNWQPEESTGHSWVCRIHKEALRLYHKMPEREPHGN